MADPVRDPTGGPVGYRVEDAVAWLVIDRPEARNAINRAGAEGLWAGFRRFEATWRRPCWC
jgi:enoyl-CoA hydratase/carnithine racemase